MERKMWIERLALAQMFLVFHQIMFSWDKHELANLDVSTDKARERIIIIE